MVGQNTDLVDLADAIAEMIAQIASWPEDFVDAVTEMRLARAFTWYALSKTLFATGRYAFHPVLHLLEDLAACAQKDWGAAGLAMCYHAMDQVSRVDANGVASVRYLTGYAHAWQVLLFAYLLTCLDALFTFHNCDSY